MMLSQLIWTKIDMDIIIAEFFQEECDTKTRDANHIMPKTKIPDLAWYNYTPATVTELDILAIEQGNVENLECYCINCFSEEPEINEIEDTIAIPQEQVRPSKCQIVSFYRNLFQPAYTPTED